MHFSAKVLVVLTALGLGSSAAHAAGEGLSGFQSVDIKVAVPLAGGSPCQVDPGPLRAAIADRIAAAGIAIGSSALTLRARVTTLSDPIGGRCVSAVELEAYTAQNTVIQATRNSIVAEIPLWSQTSIAMSNAAGHTSRLAATVAGLADKFVASYRAHQ
jgi:hypothetical protein